MISFHYLLISTSLIYICKCDDIKIEVVSKDSYFLGEGPFWDNTDHVLYHVDSFHNQICRLNVSTGETERHNMGDYVSIVVPVSDRTDKLVVTRRNQLMLLDWKTKQTEVIDSVGNEKFNDGFVDLNGRLWVGTLRNSDWNTNFGAVPLGGGLWRLDGRKLTKTENYTLPNGMAWTNDYKRFFCADTMDRVLYSYDYDLSSGTMSNKKVFLDFKNNPDFSTEDEPDGIVMDKNNKLWIAVLNGYRIVQVNIDNGYIERTIHTGVYTTTSVVFGGPDFKHLFVTTGTRGANEEQIRANHRIGRVLRITGTGIEGKPEPKVKLIM